MGRGWHVRRWVGMAVLLAGAGVGGWGCGAKGVEARYAPPGRIERWSNDLWGKVLDAVVTDDGYVWYDKLKSDEGGVRDKLFEYVGRIGAVSPVNRPELFPTASDELAYWINAYNAVCLYRVVERGYPADMSKGVVPYAIYYADKVPFGGVSMNLDTVERTKVRVVGDPRVHFALNCCSHFCPPLRREPYEGGKLEAQLADQGHRYLSDARAVRVVSPGVVEMNSIFTKFYPEDFRKAYAKRSGKALGRVTLLEAIRPYAAEGSPVLTANEVRAGGYDWTINDASRWSKEAGK